jgi:hypothetical protein
MMDRNFPHRLSKIEKLVSSTLKERKAKEKQAFKRLPFRARHHATAVAAIVLSGKPKINEPLIRAWKRALQHYGIDVNEPGGMDDQVRAAWQLLPVIIGDEKESAKFTKIFRKAPVWFLQFTGLATDARFLKFQLPNITRDLRWGSAGFEDARRWPLLPAGTMTAGDPIPLIDGRRLWLDLRCVITTPSPDFEDMLSRDEEENPPHHDNDPFYDFYEDILFALRLGEKPEEEWSRYEKRRMRRCSERITSFDIEFSAAARAAKTRSAFARVCKRFGLPPVRLTPA